MQLGRFGIAVERGIHKTSIVVNYAAIIVLFLMMLAITVDVIGRFVFHAPFTGTFDIVEMMMVILVFGSLAYCALMNGHTRVDLVYNGIPKRARGILDIITFIPSVFIMVLISWRLGDRAWRILQEPPGPVTLTLAIPHWPMIFVASLGCLLFALELLVYLFHAIKRAKTGL